MKLNEEIERIISKKCLAGLKGVECPDVSKLAPGKGNVRNLPTSTLSLLIAGMGYDTWGHSVKPQILNSESASPLSQIVVNTMSMTMNDARQFFSQVYPINPGKNTFYNGLYTHNGGADDIFTKFFDGNFNLLDAQQQYITHEVSIPNYLNITTDFEKIIEILPEQLDQNMYQKVIEFFGDSVMISAKYGGVVDSTVSIKSCFSDANMENYLKNELAGIISGKTEGVPNGYIRYHKVSQLDIAGGNPEISNVGQRVTTFRSNPVPLKFETIPIWKVFPEGVKRNNMKTVYEDHVKSKSSTVESMINRLKELRDQQALKPQPFSGYARHRNGQLYGIGSGNVAIGQSVNFATVNYKFWMPNGQHFRETIGTTTVRINRHDVNNFNMEAIQKCSASSESRWARTPTLSSNTVSANCAYIHIDPQSTGNIYENIRYDDLIGLYVCSGCASYISGSDLKCDCPFVQ